MVFGIDDMAMATGLSALGQLGGGIFSAQGAAAQNAANIKAQQDANFQNQMFQQQTNNQNQTFQNNVNVANWDFQREVNAQNIALQRENRDWSSAQADKAREWQLGVSGSQYQRAMGDMRAAGLNPLLAYQQGGSGNLSGGQATSAAAQAASSQGYGVKIDAPKVNAALQGNNPDEFIGRAIGNVSNAALGTFKMMEDINLVRQSNKESQQREKTGKADEDIKVKEKEIMDKYESKQAPDTLERILRRIDQWLTGNSGTGQPVKIPGTNIQMPPIGGPGGLFGPTVPGTAKSVLEGTGIGQDRVKNLGNPKPTVVEPGSPEWYKRLNK